MEIGKSLGDSLEYAKEAVWGKWVKWILLIISTIIFPLMLGYTMEIYRGKKPAPELEHWGKLFIDGLKLLVAGLIWAIPIIIVAMLAIGAPIFAMMGNPSPEVMMGAFAAMAVGLIITLIVAFIIALFSLIGIIRMARTERFGEAFNFSAILAKIRAIGWGSYIIALIVLWIVSFIIAIILNIIMAIPFIGWLIYLFLVVPFIIFEARYVTLLYESGVESAPIETV
jgi:hypothetical protein